MMGRTYADRNLESEREAKRKWYHNNKEKHRETRLRIEHRKREWFRQFKSTLSCERCPENHPACLQFHHKNGDKTKNISDMVIRWSEERILEEIAKCEVLCANCHFKEHSALSTSG
jgi:hypothetical protein